ncbi:TetR/AcrR family transcriptional regulator [Cohnella hashimotonis]|uniref:TetR/AcrR family transcriptional regulator n=1 Tax=Cohnella hashimotonis TaxID=2826895 RepID=A0ABT6TJ03_9BACL|nr:TetR/AcrR family transcriptional regulator [Cohnella hashimotonis]MDI4646694.1 TetR/AcrR family transcriptional regulator [Cohnella hashimotonis]
MAVGRLHKFEGILDAAVKVFAEHGYHGSQISKIAKEAGVADGTIYLYFKNKEDILVSLFRERLGRLIGKFEASARDSKSAEDALRTICALHYAELERHPLLAHVTQIELRQSALALRKEIGKTLKPYLRLIENVLLDGIASGAFRPELNVVLSRQLIFGAMDEAVSSWLLSERKYSLAAQVEGTVDFFLRALKS